MVKNKIDEIDLKILRILNQNARVSLSNIADELGMSITAVKKRISKLEKANVITGYYTGINPKKLGYNMIAIVGIRVEPEKREKIIQSLIRYEGIIELYEVTGSYDLIAKIVARDIEHLRDLLAVPGIQGILGTESMIILSSYDLVGKLFGGNNV